MTVVNGLGLLIFTTLVLGLSTSCASDDSNENRAQADVEVQTDTGGGGSVLGLDDVEDEDPCEGIQSQPAAQTEPYHEECAGIEECTQMTPVSEGSCFCAICGKKAGQSKCLQVQCPQG